jgi:hypothetical protein
VLPPSSPTRPRRPRRSPSLRLHPWLFKAETLQPNSREWKELLDLQNAALSRQWPEHLCSRWFGPLSRSHGRYALGRPFKRVLKESPSERRRSRKGHHYAVSVKTEHAVRRYDLDAYRPAEDKMCIHSVRREVGSNDSPPLHGQLRSLVSVAVQETSTSRNPPWTAVLRLQHGRCAV